MSSIFSTDPSFCPHCGTILPLPGEGAIVTCKLCEFRQDTTVYERLEEYSYKYFASRREATRLSSEGEGPLVERRCPKCGNEEMSYSTQQTRSADEGQTIFYSCPKCKFKEVENS